jgi:hypothetical protein
VRFLIGYGVLVDAVCHGDHPPQWQRGDQYPWVRWLEAQSRDFQLAFASGVLATQVAAP